MMYAACTAMPVDVKHMHFACMCTPYERAINLSSRLKSRACFL